MKVILEIVILRMVSIIKAILVGIDLHPCTIHSLATYSLQVKFLKIKTK